MIYHNTSHQHAARHTLPDPENLVPPRDSATSRARASAREAFVWAGRVLPFQSQCQGLDVKGSDPIEVGHDPVSKGFFTRVRSLRVRSLDCQRSLASLARPIRFTLVIVEDFSLQISRPVRFGSSRRFLLQISRASADFLPS